MMTTTTTITTTTRTTTSTTNATTTTATTTTTFPSKLKLPLLCRVAHEALSDGRNNHPIRSNTADNSAQLIPQATTTEQTFRNYGEISLRTSTCAKTTSTKTARRLDW
eukprot:8738983-Pyramimonas_sp.AAC.1